MGCARTVTFAWAVLTFAAAFTSACGGDPVTSGPGGSAGGGGSTSSTGTGGTGGDVPDPSDALFDPEHVVEVAIEMAQADWDALRHQARSVNEILGEGCQDGPHASPYTYFPATVTVDGQTLETSGVRKKGFLGSASLSRPSLKVSFDEYVDGREAFGVEGLTLNNSKQDRSLVKTCLAFKVFRDAGVPASRCNFAHVTVNGADMGVYVHVEPITKRFLSKHFSDDTGNLYEGQLSDFRPGWTATYEKKTNESDPDRSDLDAVTNALGAPDAELESALGQVLDLDAFNRFWATEVLVAAWDGYNGNLNNHFVYHDPGSGKMAFLPWGPDMSFDDDDPFHSDARPQSVSAKGAIARRLYEVPALRERYVAAMNAVLDGAWKEAELQAEIDRIEAMIAPYLGSSATVADNVADSVRGFVSNRRDVITGEQSPTPPNWPFPAPPAGCLAPVATAEGTFSTTFGTLKDGNPFASGTGTLDMAVPPGMSQTASLVGAAAGYEGSADGRRELVLAGTFPDGKTRALVLYFDPEVFAAGADATYDWQSIFGLALDIPAPGQSKVLGLLADGTFHFDQAKATPGAPVSGTFTATILASPFK